jgi:hypothetical protein
MADERERKRERVSNTLEKEIERGWDFDKIEKVREMNFDRLKREKEKKKKRKILVG